MEDINKKVLLLAILKKQDDETLLDVLKKMDNTKVFSLKQGKKYLKELKQVGFVVNNELSLIGIQKAKEVELEFKL